MQPCKYTHIPPKTRQTRKHTHPTTIYKYTRATTSHLKPYKHVQAVFKITTGPSPINFQKDQ